MNYALPPSIYGRKEERKKQEREREKLQKLAFSFLFLRLLHRTQPGQMWKSIALTGACHIPSLRADRSLCLILKGCYVWKCRLTPQPQCQHSDKQDDICTTLFYSGSLCMLEIGRSARYIGEEEGAGCVGEESNYPHLRGSLRLGPSEGIWCDGLALPSFSLSHLLSLINFTSCIFHSKRL